MVQLHQVLRVLVVVLLTVIDHLQVVALVTFLAHSMAKRCVLYLQIRVLVQGTSIGPGDGARSWYSASDGPLWKQAMSGGQPERRCKVY